MFRSKILFIVGAGASSEVGLPVGAELKREIAEKINIKFDHSGQTSGDHLIADALREYLKQDTTRGNNINPFLYEAWKLVKALPLAISIDNLLDAHRGNEKAELCGKLGIISSILDAERRSKLFTNNVQDQLNFDRLKDTWFTGFTQILTENIAKSEVGNIFDNVGFVNFNYDRCIEVYLYHALQTYYAINKEDAANLISSLHIFRPYGCVGKLPWQSEVYNQSVPYGTDQTRLFSITSQIKTFTEQIRDEATVAEIKAAVRDAEIIVFLGFAFHRQNLELIAPNEPSSARRVLATCFGISASDQLVIKDEIKTLLSQENNHASIELADLKCSNLFTEYWRSLTS